MLTIFFSFQSKAASSLRSCDKYSSYSFDDHGMDTSSLRIRYFSFWNKLTGTFFHLLLAQGCRWHVSISHKDINSIFVQRSYWEWCLYSLKWKQASLSLWWSGISVLLVSLKNNVIIQFSIWRFHVLQSVKCNEQKESYYFPTNYIKIRWIYFELKYNYVVL